MALAQREPVDIQSHSALLAITLEELNDGLESSRRSESINLDDFFPNYHLDKDDAGGSVDTAHIDMSVDMYGASRTERALSQPLTVTTMSERSIEEVWNCIQAANNNMVGEGGSVEPSLEPVFSVDSPRLNNQTIYDHECSLPPHSVKAPTYAYTTSGSYRAYGTPGSVPSIPPSTPQYTRAMVIPQQQYHQARPMPHQAAPMHQAYLRPQMSSHMSPQVPRPVRTVHQPPYVPPLHHQQPLLAKYPPKCVQATYAPAAALGPQSRVPPLYRAPVHNLSHAPSQAPSPVIGTQTTNGSATLPAPPAPQQAAAARAARQKKRKAPEESSSSPSESPVLDVGDDRQQRLQKRMVKNRESAARSRMRRQMYTWELEKQVTHLKVQNSALQTRVEELEAVLSKKKLKRSSSFSL